MRGLFFFAVGVLLFNFNPSARADEVHGLITSLQTGYGQIAEGLPPTYVDSLLVQLDGSPTTSIQCSPLGTVGQQQGGPFSLDPQASGLKVMEAVLLGAYLAGKPVSLTIDSCVYQFPRIVSVTVGE